MPTLDQPSAVAQQLSGKDPSGQYILSVLFKRTYLILPDGGCVPADQQQPLVEMPREYEDSPDALACDTDFFPFKPCTDVIVKGHVYGHSSARSLNASVKVEQYSLSLVALGDRRCSLDVHNRLVFSEPTVVEQIPLRFTYAYGGVDLAAEGKYGNPIAEALKELTWLDLSRTGAYRYPRNPCGRGYLLEPTREATERLQLPNLEDAYDLLTPERLAVQNVTEWVRMPLPGATDWVNYDWFPRTAYLGLVPPHARTETPIVEIARGLTPPDIMEAGLGQPTTASAFRATCGACPALQVPHLQGTESVSLENIHPTHRQFTFRLPDERPSIWTDGRQGTLKETSPVIHTLLIEPDSNQLSIVWRGSAPALRPYLPEELARMPFRVTY